MPIDPAFTSNAMTREEYYKREEEKEKKETVKSHPRSKRDR
jgi:hypothetical protein